MLKSMTGFGSSLLATDNIQISIEMKSVNHRFFEFYARMPKQVAVYEDRIKKLLQQKVARGKMDLYIHIDGSGLMKRDIQVDWALAEQLKQAAEMFNPNVPLQFKDILKVKSVVTVEETEEPDVDFEVVFFQAVGEAIDKIVMMREAEGAFLKEDLQNHLLMFSEYVENIRLQAPKVVDAYEKRIFERVQEHLGNHVDEARILTEVAIMAEKADIHEELARLESHQQQFLTILTATEPVGRKLDFLIQEMNREINTIGSKGNDTIITKNVIELKTILEKMREQVQNVE